MRIQFSLARVAGFLATLLLIVIVWTWLDPGRDRVQIVGSLVGVQFVLLLGTLLQRPEARLRDGWLCLRPGLSVRIAFWVSVLACLILVLICLRTDWSRAARQSEPVAAVLLLLGFGAGALATGLQIFGALVRWNTVVLQQRTPLLAVHEIRWDEIVRGGIVRGLRYLWLQDCKGTVIRASLDAHGIEHLTAFLRDRDPDPDEPD